MKKIFLLTILIISISCSNKRPEPDYYKNLYTGEILNKTEFEQFRRSLQLRDIDSIKEVFTIYHYFKTENKSDSIIQNFKYDLRINDEYVLRAKSYEKIGMKIASKIFTDINGEKVVIGGKQEKPTLINLWFIHCPGCIAEIPALNKLKEKYHDKVNFVTLTFEKEKDVSKFLKKKEFNFSHIANAREYIKHIGTNPYPENIFIDKNGNITHIEGGISHYKDLDLSIEYFERIIKKLL